MQARRSSIFIKPLKQLNNLRITLKVVDPNHLLLSVKPPVSLFDENRVILKRNRINQRKLRDRL